MTTTTNFQKYPDYYESYDLAKKKHESFQTNNRYKNFCQTHFTAGDVQQFENFRYNYGGGHVINHIPNSKYWKGYHKINHQDITHTFEYIFHKFKKGIFVKIKDNKLKVFLPFSKANYFNEWSSKIDTTNFKDMVAGIYEREGYHFNEKRVNTNTYQWNRKG